jgi:outer membrane protein
MILCRPRQQAASARYAKIERPFQELFSVRSTTLLSAVVFAGLAVAQQPATKVGIIHISQAIISTKDGQKAAGELTAKFEPKKKEIEAKQSEIAALQQELAKGSNTMAEAKRIGLQRDIDAKSRSLSRETEDAEQEFQQAQNKLLNDLGGKMMVVIDKYAKENGYTLILDVSSQQTPVLYAANGVDITQTIVDLYDKNAPSNIPSAKPAATPSTPTPPPAKPPATPPTKKQ